jgi:hypothetical protein
MPWTRHFQGVPWKLESLVAGKMGVVCKGRVCGVVSDTKNLHEKTTPIGTFAEQFLVNYGTESVTKH